jgi:LAO/AO transport system kinase
VTDTPEVARYADPVLTGSRAGIARAITLVESSRPDHRALAQHVLNRLLPHASQARRVGITGVPGVGKSTFIDVLGGMLIDRGHRVAVLAVDPSSTRSGGSILGDKTRMTRLATDPDAFVRPSPTAGTLGGVARATRESLVVMAAAGYDVLLVETVGVGQSETLVAEMTDTFLLLALARTGDQLQGIKKGVLELADIVAVNKADGPHAAEARRAARELAGALRLLGQPADGWDTPVVTCSATTGDGVAEVWDLVEKHEQTLRDSGELDRRRRDQRVSWMWSLVRDQLLDRLRDSPELQAIAPALEAGVRSGTLTPGLAAQQLIAAFLPDPADPEAPYRGCDGNPSLPGHRPWRGPRNSVGGMVSGRSVDCAFGLVSGRIGL